MPLVKDGEYRGSHAAHVEPHFKLVKHRTVINDAFELASWLVDSGLVSQLDLGKVLNASGKKFTRGVKCEIVEGRTVKALLVAKSAAQEFTVRARSVDDAKAVSAEIERQWMHGRIALVEKDE